MAGGHVAISSLLPREHVLYDNIFMIIYVLYGVTSLDSLNGHDLLPTPFSETQACGKPSSSLKGRQCRQY